MRPFAEVLETTYKHELTDLVVPYLHNEDRKDLEATKELRRLSTAGELRRSGHHG